MKSADLQKKTYIHTYICTYKHTTLMNTIINYYKPDDNPEKASPQTPSIWKELMVESSEVTCPILTCEIVTASLLNPSPPVASRVIVSRATIPETIPLP